MSFPAQRGFHGSWSWSTAVRGNNRKCCCNKLETLRRLWCRSATNDEFHLRRDASIMWSRSYQVIARQNAAKSRTKSAGCCRWRGTRSFFTPSLHTVAFHFTANQCQPSRSACGWQGYHVVFTINIPINIIAVRLKRIQTSKVEEEHTSSSEMWRGSFHGTSYHCLTVECSSLLRRV